MLLVVAAACGDDPAGPPSLPPGLAGVYNLVSVSGVPLPAPVGDPFGVGRQTDFTQGIVEISTNRTFMDASTFQLRYPDSDLYDLLYLDAGGNIEVEGNTIIFRPFGAEVYTMEREGDVLLQTWGSFVLRYVKVPPTTTD